MEKEEKSILGKHENIFKTSKQWNYFFNEFSVLSDEDEEKINQNLRKVIYSKGQVIYDETNDSDYVYLVYDGLIQLKSQGTGIEINLNNGQILGFEHVFNQGRVQCKSVALKKSTLYSLPLDLFREIAEKYESIEKICKYFELYYIIKEKSIENDTDFLT